MAAKKKPVRMPVVDENGKPYLVDVRYRDGVRVVKRVEVLPRPRKGGKR